jgi:hypothetical protein
MQQCRSCRNLLYLLAGTYLLIAGGCGSGGNANAVTPVMADAKGTYRLASSAVTLTAADGAVSTFGSYSTGTLRLFDDGTYQRTMALHEQHNSSGFFFFGPSATNVTATTILNNRQGAFVLSSPDPVQPFKGAYDVKGDVILTLNYQLPQPDHSLVTRSNTWIKESDSPRQ